MYYGILVDDPFLFYPLPGYFLVVGGGGRRVFPILKVQSKYRQACENLVTPGRKWYHREVFKVIKIPTWSWRPLLIQILPVVKVVTAAFHIKNVARNHVNSSFLQRLPTVKLVWWHFLGLNNNDNTNNSVNSKNIYTLLLSTQNPFTLLTKQTTYILSLWGEYLYFKESLDEAFTGSCY